MISFLLHTLLSQTTACSTTAPPGAFLHHTLLYGQCFLLHTQDYRDIAHTTRYSIGEPSYLALCFPRILPLHTSHGALLPGAYRSTVNASSPHTDGLPWILRTPHTAVPDTPSSTHCASRNTSHYTWLSQGTTQSTRCSTGILLSLFLHKLPDLEHFLLPTLLSRGRLLATHYSARILTNPHAVPHEHFVLHTVFYWGHLLFHTMVHSGYILLQIVLSGKSPIPRTVLPNILRVFFLLHDLLCPEYFHSTHLILEHFPVRTLRYPDASYSTHHCSTVNPEKCSLRSNTGISYSTHCSTKAVQRFFFHFQKCVRIYLLLITLPPYP